MKLKRLLKPDIDLFNTIRRYIGQRLDQLIAISWKKIKIYQAGRVVVGSPDLSRGIRYH